MRIAIIAYDFPPLNSGGSQRPYLLSKYLCTENYEVIVFTLDQSCYPSNDLNFRIDSSFAKQVKVIRTLLRKERIRDRFYKSYYFNLVDRIGSRWKKSLFESIQSEHQIRPFDYCLVTCPPFSLAPLGVIISKSLGIPMILDMRDAWSQWVTAPYASYIHYRATVNLERKCFTYARFITYTSEQQKSDWLRIHPNLESSKFIYMPNGFEEYKESGEPRRDGLIRIFYAGSFYYNPESDRLINAPWYKKKPYQYFQYVPRKEYWKYRTPYYFFRIVEKVITNYPELGNKIQVRFAGKKTDWFDEMVNQFNLGRQVKHLGFLDKNEIEREMELTDYFLITSSKVENARDYSVAGKTFEYLSYRKPIIAVVNEGEQLTILDKTGLAVVLNPDCINRSSEQLSFYLKNINSIPNTSFIEKFHVPENYRQLIQLLSEENL